MDKPQSYRFLVKPVFFIVSLLCAAYIVLKLEQLKPEDVGMEIPSYHTAPQNNGKTEPTKPVQTSIPEVQKATVNK